MTEYVKHLGRKPRPSDGVIDIGAFELEDGQIPDLSIATASLPSGTVGTAYSASLRRDRWRDTLTCGRR